MLEGNIYIEIVKEYYSFLITEFNLPLINEKVRGNAFYDVQYGDKERVVSISYENIEDYLQVIIFILRNGRLPDYDDKKKTLHLQRLTPIVFAEVDKSEIDLNNAYFLKFHAKNELERELLKSAKELRLCLKHFDELQVI